MPYTPNTNRYIDSSFYRRCGRWGLKLPAISLGCWHNFGGAADADNMRKMLFTAFDLGITHFDLANNYGPPPGSAETNAGRIFKEMPRDEMILSTKAGYLMWPGPYGEYGTRKYLLASLDQSLRRLQVDYVDIFYSHRPDANTPLDETMSALDTAVKQGKALYAGLSNYDADSTRQSHQTMRDHDWAPLLIHQPSYSMLDRWIESGGLLRTCGELGIGVIAFCPLAQGLLTEKYFNGIPKASRAAEPTGFLRQEQVTPTVVNAVRQLHDVARQRGQTIAQLALAWVLRDPRVTSALIGASRPEQIVENVKAADNTSFTVEELSRIDAALASVLH